EVDWLYAEELSVRSNYFWSPDGKHILFLQMDETGAPSYPITDYSETHARADQEKYPQPGDSNPAVRLGVISTTGGKPKWLSLSDEKDVYIPRFGWVNDEVAWAEVLNRKQDHMDYYFVNTKTGDQRKVLTDDESGYWVNVNDDFRLLKSGDRFVMSSWRDGHTHLYLYSFDKQDPLSADARLERQLTRGDFEVLGVQAVDEAAGVAYFTCNIDDPRQVQLYSVKLDGTGLRKVSQEGGTHKPTFADNAKYYVDDYSATLTPPRLSVCAAGEACKTVWDSRTVTNFALIQPKFLEFTADDGTKLYGSLLLPPEGVGNGKLPLIVDIYGGPAAQVVVNEWIGTTGLFHQLMARRGFAIFAVDNRGTPGRDRKFQSAVRNQFGAVELEDQLAALDQLLAQYSQIDRSRVGIWGWSNGGSMTLYAMTHSDAFKAGVSVAPVSQWRLYDSTYTERWLGTPQTNLKGYNDSDMTASAASLHGSLLLVHGTSDDNVHFQNTVQMVDALIKAGKQFRLMIYPGKTHGIGGSADRNHLFHMIEDHFERELK
ncbi:MAG TPA: DPP IV N-terminal domain-containing protein, partial [Terriglobales bacterium]